VVKSRRFKWAGNAERMGRYVYKNLVGELEKKRPRGRLRCMRENNVRNDPKGIGRESVDWINLAQGRHQWRAVVSTVINLRVP
jgi:hypothetical protein